MVQIREANEEDLDAILTLWEEFTQYLQKVEPDFFQLKTNAREIYQKRLKEQINLSNNLVIVVEDEGKLVGYHIASIRYPGEVFIQEPYGHISDLYLKADYRGIEIGRRLVQYTKKWLKERGISHLNVKTFTDNPGGVVFWEKNGFEKYEVTFKCNLKKF
ncbi:hypothetical protein BBF96_04075 [Anoxybacter fermentans]|uniref:N-acetyltransferase domain-containing protein n=1 Tax=Anoxybacter fermentans TaxID=1323375 RepID=A0A3Q9HPB8_9FIRM|nr:GNAT family N-acetyltransferase [Anoxybacter fermentans]AZR72637.1 hypothetical protein BBF96_04075 [Anoxybacter fermentans]